MLLSMTGYGRATGNYQNKNITVEIRSLNSKYTDVKFRLPQNYREKEVALRRVILAKAERGKIELSIDVQSPEGDDAFGLNIPLFKKYYKVLSGLNSELDKNVDNPDLFSAILRLPNVVSTQQQSLDEKEWAMVKMIVEQALMELKKFRTQEGHATEQDLSERTHLIADYIGELAPLEEDRVEKLRSRIYQNLEEYLGKDKIDENRFEQEILFYLEKMDINEEKVRLSQHCKHLLEVINNKTTSKGRKLNFISQEMGREINTLGAKAYSSDIQRIVVAMKDELEKIKEQIANLV